MLQLRAIDPPLQLQHGITQAEKAATIRAFIMLNWEQLGPHIDLSVRAWNIDQYTRLFGNELGEEIFVFNQEQAQIPVAADRQTIPNMLPQPLAPPGLAGPARPPGALANLLQRGGREVGVDINRAGQMHPPNDYLTFLRESAFAQDSTNAMRQRLLLSWMGNVDGQNVDDADQVNALHNLLNEEQDDASTQLLVAPDANFNELPAGERHINNLYAPPQGLAAPGEANHHGQEQALGWGAAQQQPEQQGGKYTQSLCFHACNPL